MRGIKWFILALLIVIVVLLTACATTTVTETTIVTQSETRTQTVATTSETIEAPQESTPPIVRISDKDYGKDAGSFMRVAEGSVLSNQTLGWALSNQQVFVDSAVKKAEELNLDGGNLKEIITKLVLYVDQLDFKGKNVNESGVEWTFRISKQTIQLPYVIEKAKYQGKEAWLVALNWETNYESHMTSAMSHIAGIVFEYGSETVLFAMSCA